LGVAVGGGAVAVGTDVFVGGISVDVAVAADGISVEAGAHPLNKTVRNTNVRKTDPIELFMTFSPFDLTCDKTPNGLRY